MKKNNFIFLLILALLLTQGCISRFVTDKKYTPTDPDKVELYFTKTPNRDYDEIAFVFEGNGSFKDLKNEAAKLGANAVLQIRLFHGYNGMAVRWK